MRTLLLTFLLVSCIFSEPLTVVIHNMEPCVITGGGKPTGFDIEIWETIAKDAGLEFKYREVDSFKDMLATLQEGDADVAISGITITDTREEVMDFSHPYMKSGLSIMTKAKQASFLSVIESYMSNTWPVLIIFVSFLLACGFIIRLIEKGNPSFKDTVIEGTAEGAWWTNVTMTTVGYGDFVPRTWSGRIFATLVMWLGIYVVSPYVIAKMNVAMTEQTAYNNIKSEADLNKLNIASVSGTTTIPVLERLGAVAVGRENIEKCYELLERGVVGAVVFDMPVLKYFVKKQGRGKFQLVGETFDDQYYGIALKQGSSYRERINCALLRIQEDGRHKFIYDKWFK